MRLPTRPRNSVALLGGAILTCALLVSCGGGGGSTPTADAGRAYVIQPNGKIESRRRLFWFYDVDPTPRAGATVFVPPRDSTTTTGSTLQTISIATQLAATILTALAVAKK